MVVMADAVVRPPAPFSTPRRTFWTRDRVYHVEEGESGVPEIQVYRIERERFSDGS
jgi:hypothetical protein